MVFPSYVNIWWIQLFDQLLRVPNINIRIVVASVENDGDDNIFHIFT